MGEDADFACIISRREPPFAIRYRTRPAGDKRRSHGTRFRSRTGTQAGTSAAQAMEVAVAAANANAQANLVNVIGCLLLGSE